MSYVIVIADLLVIFASFRYSVLVEIKAKPGTFLKFFWCNLTAWRFLTFVSCFDIYSVTVKNHFFGQKITTIWAFQSNFLLSLCIQNNCCWVFYYYYYYCLALWTIRSKCFVEEFDLLSFSLGLLVMIWSSWWKCLVYNFIISFIGHSSCQVQCLENFVMIKWWRDCEVPLVCWTEAWANFNQIGGFWNEGNQQ